MAERQPNSNAEYRSNINEARPLYHGHQKAGLARRTGVRVDTSKDLNRPNGKQPIFEVPTEPEPATRLLGVRVDKLDLTFKLQPKNLLREAFEELSSDDGDFVAVAITKELSATLNAKRGGLTLRNADLLGAYDRHAHNAWQLDLGVTAAWLATHTLEETIDYLLEVARELGADTEQPRIKRVDLAADFVGFALSSCVRQAGVAVANRVIVI